MQKEHQNFHPSIDEIKQSEPKLWRFWSGIKELQTFYRNTLEKLLYSEEQLKNENEKLKEQLEIEEIINEARDNGADWVILIKDMQNLTILRSTPFVKHLIENAQIQNWKDIYSDINIQDGITQFQEFHNQLVWLEKTQKAIDILQKLKLWVPHQNAIFPIKQKNNTLLFVKVISYLIEKNNTQYCVTSFIDFTNDIWAKSLIDKEKQHLIESLNFTIQSLEIFLQVTINTSHLLPIVEENIDEKLHLSESITTVNNKLTEMVFFINEMMKNLKNIWELSKNLHLLSLNANIEAARAGDAGRGFWVVAQETGKISLNAQTLNTDIQKEMIPELTKNMNSVQHETENMSTIVANSHTWETLNQTVNDFHNMISESAKNIQAIHTNLRASNQQLKARYKENPALSPKQKIMEHLALTKIDHKIFIVELILQSISLNKNYKVSNHTACDLWKYIQSKELIEYLKHNIPQWVHNPVYQKLLQTHETFHSLADNINANIIKIHANNSLHTISDIYSTIKGELSTSMENTLNSIDALLSEIDSKYHEQIKKFES